MADDKKTDQAFEVEELSDESLEGVAGGATDAELVSDGPGNNCTNNATGC